MQYIKKLIFGNYCTPVSSISTGFKTVMPDNLPENYTEQMWYNEFKVSSMYDRRITHI